MSKILVCNLEPDRYSSEAVALLKTKFEYLPEVNVNAEVLIVRLARKIDSSVLMQFPHLKWIVTATTGLDHLDLDELQRRGIQYLSLKGETSFLETIPSTAELSWGLLIALMRHIPASVQAVDSGIWDRDLFRGFQLRGKTLGIIGLGRIGKMMAHYGEAFGMNVQYFDPNVSQNSYLRKETMEDLVESSDIISLHIPYDNQTHGVINQSIIGRFKEGCWFLNTSRGGIVDEEALVNALESEKIKGIATDVLSTELVDYTKSPLYRARAKGLPVIITPHIGGASLDAMHACEVFMAKKLLKQYFG